MYNVCYELVLNSKLLLNISHLITKEILSVTEFHRIFSALSESILSVTEFHRIYSAFSENTEFILPFSAV
jgi:hypothetical protein